MLHLEPILTRFVDDVLRAIRKASIDELCELLPAGAGPRARAMIREVAPPAAARTPATPVRARATPVRARATTVRAKPTPVRAKPTAHAAEKPTARPERPRPVPAVTRARTAPAPRPRWTHAASEPHAFAEITDPERLLASGELPIASTTVRGETPAEAAPTEETPPRSTERPTASARAQLRDGETFARDTGNGVVIRRAKRA